MSACIGRVIDGKYVIRQSLGRGGVGEVFLADHVTLGCHVAVKLLRTESAYVREEVERFVLEAKTCARIVSDHVVRILDLGALPSGELYLVMEHLAGETLAQRLERVHVLRPSQVAELGIQVASALDATHAAGVVHRDVTPQNVFYATSFEAERVKLLDFGVCRLLASSTKRTTTPGAIVGTPAYMSPEQVRGEPVDARSDLYSLGVALHEAATGRLPYAGRTAQDLIMEIAMRPPGAMVLERPLDAGLVAIITRALAPRIEDRFDDAAEMRDALIAWLASAQSADAANVSGVRFRFDSKSSIKAAR